MSLKLIFFAVVVMKTCGGGRGVGVPCMAHSTRGKEEKEEERIMKEWRGKKEEEWRKRGKKK